VTFNAFVELKSKHCCWHARSGRSENAPTSTEIEEERGRRILSQVSKMVDHKKDRSGRNETAVPGDECPGVPTSFPPDGHVHVGSGGGSGAV